MNERSLFFFIKALHNKRMLSNRDDADFGLELFSNDLQDYPIVNETAAPVENIKKIENETKSKSENKIQKEAEESDIEEENEPKNELVFTSDYTIFSYDEESDIENSSFSTRQNENKAKFNADPKLNVMPSVILERLDLKQFKQTKNKSFSLFISEHSLSTNCVENEIEHKKKAVASFSNLRRSPTRNNISKLNFFRKIFKTEHDQNEFNSMNSVNSSSTEDLFIKKKESYTKTHILTGAGSKFHKLNELVSIRINEDYFNESEKPNPNTPFPKSSEKPHSSVFDTPKKSPPLSSRQPVTKQSLLKFKPVKNVKNIVKN